MKKQVLGIFVFAFLFFSGLFSAATVFAQNETKADTGEYEAGQYQEETLEGKVVQILDERQITPTGATELQLYQKLELLVTKGTLKGDKIIVENGALLTTNIQKYKVGDRLVVIYGQDIEGKDSFVIADYIRRGGLFWLFVIFVVMVGAIARWQGMASLLGMGISFLVIFEFILPKISAGGNPVQIAILGSLVIIPATFILSHGANKKTLVAIVGTLIALIITGILAEVFVEVTRLTGFASEEAGFLQAYHSGLINIKGLLLAGIIIGVLGVLDDITVSQSAIVQKLKEANPKQKANELYKKAMAVGKDHIASMVNTLILVYTGAALPLLILFIDSPRPFSEVINYEIVADEVVRTLVGSIGLILAVPITTFIAVLSAERKYDK
jgi:uncharacterized membrane protein